MRTKIKIHIPGAEEAWLSSNGELRQSDAVLYEFIINKAIETGSGKISLDLDELAAYMEDMPDTDNE
jgi:hypothetical protein